MSTSFIERPVDLFFAIFFAVHIGPSLLFAPQVVMPPSWRSWLVPPKLQNMLLGAVEQTHDPLLATALPGAIREPWIIAIFGNEVFFQLPFFVFAIVCLSMNWRDTFRIPAIIYATNAITSMVPIFAELVFGRSATFLTNPVLLADEQSIRTVWIAMYAAFAIVPALLLVNQVFFFTPSPKVNPAKKIAAPYPNLK